MAGVGPRLWNAPSSPSASLETAEGSEASSGSAKSAASATLKLAAFPSSNWPKVAHPELET